MSLRETLSNSPRIGIALGAAAILLAVIFLWPTLFAGAPHASMPSRVYFSDDDGKTFFTDDSSNIPPFDHGGKQALQAAVFECGGKQFVGYLIRFDNGAKAALEAMPEEDRKGSNPKALLIRQTGEMVKKPGNSHWVALKGDEPAGQIVSPVCPDGSDETPKQVMP